VLIITEATASRGLLLPLMAAALVADQASQWVCKEKLYHGLSRTFSTRESAQSASR
jgi:H+/Cl- antiporter ClcA